MAIENETRYAAAAVKSGPSVFNAQSKRGQADEPVFFCYTEPECE